MKLDKHNPPHNVVFEGTTYRLMGTKKYYLSMCKTNAGRRRAKGLHVAIWEHANNQSVPQGYHIHHKDGDTFNNDPNNLEALPAKVHWSQPKRMDMPKQIEHLRRIRPLAASWHSTDEGIAWHREHAKRSIRKPGVKRTATVRGVRSCKWCGAQFEYKGHRAMFCSKACQAGLSRLRLGRSSVVHDHYRATSNEV